MYMVEIQQGFAKRLLERREEEVVRHREGGGRRLGEGHKGAAALPRPPFI